MLFKVLTSPIPLLPDLASRSRNSESLGRLLTKADSSSVPLLLRFILQNKDLIGDTSITLRSSSLFSWKLEEHAFTKQSFLVRVCSSSFHDNNDKDLKVIDVSPINSLFCNMNLDNDGTGDESTLVKRRPNDSEFLDLDTKIGKCGIEEVNTLHSNQPTILDFKEFNYDNCSLIDCISLLQSVLNSPHAYSQNKAFTKHIVDALM